MIGDLILIFVFAVIWQRIIKLRKTDFREFIFELSIYFAVFCLNLIFYKSSYLILSLIFDFGLFPSIVGVFALSFIIFYAIIRFFVYYLFKKKYLSIEKREKIINKEISFFDFFIHSMEDFQKAFTIFFVINLVIIFTLLNSFVDVFTHQRILTYENNKALDAKVERMIVNAKGNESFKNNLRQTFKFLRTVDPRAYEKIIKHTNHFVISSKNAPLALARCSDGSIIFSSIFAKLFNSLEDQIYFATVMVHESEHLKNFREESGFIVNSLNYAYLKVKCNPITNYQYLSHYGDIFQGYGDEWCAEISEVKFLKQFNIDYKEYRMKYFEDN